MEPLTYRLLHFGDGLVRFCDQTGDTWIVEAKHWVKIEESTNGN